MLFNTGSIKLVKLYEKLDIKLHKKQQNITIKSDDLYRFSFVKRVDSLGKKIKQIRGTTLIFMFHQGFLMG